MAKKAKVEVDMDEVRDLNQAISTMEHLDARGKSDYIPEVSPEYTKEDEINDNNDYATGKKKLINCLQNKTIIIRHVPKQNSRITNPKHILYGGMADDAVRYYTVPRLTSGRYINVLTDSEKAYLEDIMGLEFNALSIYKKADNYWDNYMVRLTKYDNFLDLSDPNDYIKYKVLLANKDLVAPSLQALSDYPKATYQYVVVSKDEETKVAKDNMSNTMKCYKEFGKIEDNIDILRLIVETIDGRPVASHTKLDFLQTKINSLIQSDSKLFLKVVTDPYLDTKVLIKKAIEAGSIVLRGNYLYVRDGNLPMCETGEEPTLTFAAKYLSSPKHQDLKFSIQANLEK